MPSAGAHGTFDPTKRLDAGALLDETAKRRGLDVDDAGFREVELPHGRTLVVRRMTEADARALGELYAGLSLDDRHRRFLSVYYPSRSFLEHYAGTNDEQGYGLVAIVTNGEERVVGEAAYTVLPNGSGELGITVAHDWRGWLGPYLLDALLEAATAQSVPSLQADVFADNAPMLALARSRGGVTIERPHMGVVRVAIPAREPVREPSGGPRQHERLPVGGREDARRPVPSLSGASMIANNLHDTDASDDGSKRRL